MSLAGALLERAARATPAGVEDHSSGWWLRHTDGSAWWSGSVLAHDAADDGHVAERIDLAERFYAEHRATARFQVCDGCPADLDAMLAERGYRRASPISLRVASRDRLVAPPASAGLAAHLCPDHDEAWLSVLWPNSGPQTSAEYQTGLLRRVRLPSAYVTVFTQNEPIAIGRAVSDDGWTGVFSMVTRSSARRRGAAGLVLAAIADWAAEQHAPRLYLQVERSNTAATRLYAIAGFTEIASYHYRVKDNPAPG